jgi:two-component system, LytTR family, response regulator
MLKTIIIDDEKNTREVLGKLLQDYCPDVKVEAMVSSLEEGRQEILKHRPDLVFLDIEFPNESGFSLLEQEEMVDFHVIFISGHEEYAIKALRADAVDYLLKPFNPKEMEIAVQKVLDKRLKSEKFKHAEILVQNWKSAQDRQIALSSTEGFLFVKIQDIIYCKGDGAYTYFYIKGSERVTVSKNLKEFEVLLQDCGFFRIHKSYLINLNEMKRYIRGEGGYVVMSNGDSVDVSKRRKEAFMSNLSKV